MQGKFKVVIHPRVHADKENVRSMTIEEIIESAGADWDPKDPGVGQAVILPDGREVFNPVPFAPPVGFNAEPDMMTRLQQMLRQEMLRQKDADEVVDTVEEMRDFPEDTEAPFYSHYELLLMDEVPVSPPLPEPGETSEVHPKGDNVSSEDSSRGAAGATEEPAKP